MVVTTKVDSAVIHSCLNQDLAEPVLYEFLWGCAVLFSTRAPDKQGSNEDSAALINRDDGSGVIIVADGLGGVAGGDDASRTVVKILADQIRIADPVVALREVILNGIDAANRALLDRGLGNATTLAIAEVNSHYIRTYHVGDAVVLLTGQRGKLKLQTMSHSPTGYAIESGLIDENEAMGHEARHLVSNVVGSPEMRVEMGPDVAMAARDTVIVSSDGLFDNLFIEEIIELIRKGPLIHAARQLCERASGRMRIQGNEPSHPDDMTFVLFRRTAMERRNPRSVTP